jgi:hypothetical protein
LRAIGVSASPLTSGTSVGLQEGQPFNPYGLFTGIFIPEALVRYPEISAGAKIAYGRLVRYAGQDGDCHPSVKTLAREIGVRERQTQRYLAELESNGFIRSFARFRGPSVRDANGYVFLWHPTFVGSIRNAATPVSSLTPPRVPLMTPRVASLVTPKESHREESQKKESQSSSSPIVLKEEQPPPPTPSSERMSGPTNVLPKIDDDLDRPNQSPRDQLIATIQKSTGHPPDQRLVRDILEGLELRGVPLQDYLEDIRPRLGRLRHRPGPGFFHRQMTAWRDSRPARRSASVENPMGSRCLSCSGSGKRANGYCDCPMGRDLERVETRVARKRAVGEVGK